LRIFMLSEVRDRVTVPASPGRRRPRAGPAGREGLGVANCGITGRQGAIGLIVRCVTAYMPFRWLRGGKKFGERDGGSSRGPCRYPARPFS
jgi:hypothetical protein